MELKRKTQDKRYEPNYQRNMFEEDKQKKK